MTRFEAKPAHQNAHRSDYIIVLEIVHAKFQISWSYNKATKGKLDTRKFEVKPAH